MAIVNIGDLISFKTKNLSDPNTYYGKVIGLLTFDVAKKFRDVMAYHNVVMSYDSTVPQAEQCSYFIMQIMDPEDNSIVSEEIFAMEWIDDNTYTKYESTGKLKVVIFNVDQSNIDSILETIRSALPNHLVIMESFTTY